MVGFSGAEPDNVRYHKFFKDAYRVVFETPITIDGDIIKVMWNSSKGLKLFNDGNYFDPSSNDAQKMYDQISEKVNIDMKKLKDLFI